MSIKERIAGLNWAGISNSMDSKGYALVKNVLRADECDNLTAQYTDEQLYRKTIVMEHHQYGLGGYKYFKYPLPTLIQQLRENVYPQLAPIANRWMQYLDKEQRFPGTLNELLEHCHEHEQLRPPPPDIAIYPGWL